MPKFTMMQYVKTTICTDESSVETRLGGYTMWLLNGKKHRTSGPAVITPSGSQEWHQNGELHREDGPAIEYPNGFSLRKMHYRKRIYCTIQKKKSTSNYNVYNLQIGRLGVFCCRPSRRFSA